MTSQPRIGPRAKLTRTERDTVPEGRPRDADPVGVGGVLCTIRMCPAPPVCRPQGVALCQRHFEMYPYQAVRAIRTFIGLAASACGSSRIEPDG